MLTDRRALLEHEFKKAHDMAAAVYLSIVVNGIATSDDEYHKYSVLKERVASLQFDLNIVNGLISKGV